MFYPVCSPLILTRLSVAPFHPSASSRCLCVIVKLHGSLTVVFHRLSPPVIRRFEYSHERERDTVCLCFVLLAGNNGGLDMNDTQRADSMYFEHSSRNPEISLYPIPIWLEHSSINTTPLVSSFSKYQVTSTRFSSPSGNKQFETNTKLRKI